MPNSAYLGYSEKWWAQTKRYINRGYRLFCLRRRLTFDTFSSQIAAEAYDARARKEYDDNDRE